jgi:hypothetical protein
MTQQPDQPVTFTDHAAAIAEEYGRYVANQPIFIGGARAFNPGDPVPVSHLDRGLVQAQQVTDLAAPEVEEPAPAAAPARGRGTTAPTSSAGSPPAADSNPDATTVKD